MPKLIPILEKAPQGDVVWVGDVDSNEPLLLKAINGNACHWVKRNPIQCINYLGEKSSNETFITIEELVLKKEGSWTVHVAHSGRRIVLEKETEEYVTQADLTKKDWVLLIGKSAGDMYLQTFAKTTFDSFDQCDYYLIKS